MVSSEQSQFDLANNFSTYENMRSITTSLRIASRYAERAKTYDLFVNGRLILRPEAVQRFSNKVNLRAVYT